MMTQDRAGVRSEKCSVDGCERQITARGLCRPHYTRHRKNIDMNKPIGKPRGGHPIRPCKFGHGIERYANGNCVECAKARAARQYTPGMGYRRVKPVGSPVTFQGTTCGKGHSGLRYSTSGNCVECTKAMAGRSQKPRSQPS